MGSKWADCRKCIYFIPAKDLDPEKEEEALVWVAKLRPGSRVLGWCRYYDRPVTYYEGFCPAFRERPVNVRSLEEFMGGGNG